MIKNSDKNKLQQFNYTVTNQKNKTIELNLKNSMVNSTVKNYNFSFDLLRQNVRIDTDWETLDYLETLRYQYKFWKINLEKIDITLLPFINIEILTQNNIQNSIAKISKVFQIDEDGSIKINAGIYFSEYSEMEQYNPIEVKLLIYFNNIPQIRKQNLNIGGNFINNSMGGGVGG